MIKSEANKILRQHTFSRIDTAIEGSLEEMSRRRALSGARWNSRAELLVAFAYSAYKRYAIHKRYENQPRVPIFNHL